LKLKGFQQFNLNGGVLAEFGGNHIFDEFHQFPDLTMQGQNVGQQFATDDRRKLENFQDQKLFHLNRDTGAPEHAIEAKTVNPKVQLAGHDLGEILEFIQKRPGGDFAGHQLLDDFQKFPVADTGWAELIP